MLIKLGEKGVEGPFRDFVTALDRMCAAHQHFRLDNRDDPGFLTERSVAAQRMGIGFDPTF